ncbi:MAG: DUF4837 family protein [Balneolaceae bacterium]
METADVSIFYRLPMMRSLGILILLGAAFFSGTACEGDFRQRAIGDNHVIFVVMDSTLHDSRTADALRETFGRPVETLPNPEEQYTLRFRDFRTNDELDELRKFKNIIFAGPVNDQTNTSAFIRAVLSESIENRVRAEESFAFPLRDQWYRDQWALILTSTDDAALAEEIRNAGESLVENAMAVELERWQQSIYRRGEQTDLSDSLRTKYGWEVRMQHDYIWTVDTLNVVSFRRALPENDRWMWGWWKDGVENPDMIDQNWINAARDSIMERYVQGTREGSYVTTEYSPRRDIETREIERDDRLIGWETLGTWRMTRDFMGGPFVNFTYYDPETERLFMIEYGQFAPGVEKRRFVQQFRAMGRTFRSDSTFTPGDYPEDYEFVSIE